MPEYNPPSVLKQLPCCPTPNFQIIVNTPHPNQTWTFECTSCRWLPHYAFPNHFQAEQALIEAHRYINTGQLTIPMFDTFAPW